MHTNFSRVTETLDSINAVLRRGIEIIDDQSKIRAVVHLVSGLVPNASDSDVKTALRHFCRINQETPLSKGKGGQNSVSYPISPRPKTSVGKTICDLLREKPGRKNGDIAKITREKVPGAKTTAATVAAYRTALVAIRELPSHRPIDSTASPTVGELICKLLLQNPGRKNGEIAADVARQMNSKTTNRDVSNYRTYLRNAGVIQ